MMTSYRAWRVLMGRDTNCTNWIAAAVLTADYAQEIGATYYAKDAMASVRLAESFSANN